MLKKNKKINIIFSSLLVICFFFFFSVRQVKAQDTDSLLDSLANYLKVSLTELSVIDSDQDGYFDDQEILAGYTPFDIKPIKLLDSDVDNDALSDYWELIFNTNPLKADTDEDGFSDYQEIDFAYNPLSPDNKKLSQKVVIDLQSQTLFYYVKDNIWQEFIVSTGKPSMPTPSGEFIIVNKIKKAWSKSYSLWMPFWLGLDRGRIGIHELPIWPNGYREGNDHLGQAVSHGCIRLGVGPAEYLYNRLDVGMKIIIK